MGMIVSLLIIAAIVGAAIWAFKRSTAKKPSPTAASTLGSAARESAGEQTKVKLGAVVLVGPNHCSAINKFVDVWIPADQLPQLPIAGCTDGHGCQCRFRRTPDRRVEIRRKQEDRRGALRFEDKQDRRSMQDRRKDASNPWINN